MQVASEVEEEDKTPVNEKKSKLAPKLQKLMSVIFDRKKIANTLEELGYDSKKMPLGTLTEQTINEGFHILSKIEKELEKKKKIKLKELSS